MTSENVLEDDDDIGDQTVFTRHKRHHASVFFTFHGVTTNYQQSQSLIQANQARG